MSLRVVLLLLAVAAGCLRISAQQIKYPAYTAHVNDFAGALDQATKSQLETILINFEKLTGAQIAVVTMKTLGERPIEEYSNGLYRAWGVGAKSGANKDKGALLLVVTEDRRSRLEVGYGLEGDLPDGLAGEMLRRMRPYFQQQRWSEGLTVGTRTLVDTLAAKWNVNVEGIDRAYAYQGPSAQPGEDFGPGGLGGPIAFVVIMLVVFYIISRISRGGGGRGGGGGRRSAWWGAPIIFSQGGGGFGGGGWGSSGGWGGGGGSSWGGFGGGSSGGGGASDSW